MSTGLALAKMGLAEMALTGTVSEPLFSCLIGLACAMLKSSIENGGSITFSIEQHKQAILPLVGIAVCMTGLIGSLAYYCITKFHLKKFPAIIQLIIYAVFFGIIITLTALLPEKAGH